MRAGRVQREKNEEACIRDIAEAQALRRARTAIATK
jgi:hypothetical protein